MFLVVVIVLLLAYCGFELSVEDLVGGSERSCSLRLLGFMGSYCCRGELFRDLHPGGHQSLQTHRTKNDWIRSTSKAYEKKPSFRSDGQELS